MSLGPGETEARVALRRRQGHSGVEAFLLCLSSPVPVGLEDRSCRKGEGKGTGVGQGLGTDDRVLGFNTYSDLRGSQNAHCDPQLAVIWAPHTLDEICNGVCTLEPSGLWRGLSVISPLG